MKNGMDKWIMFFGFNADRYEAVLKVIDDYKMWIKRYGICNTAIEYLREKVFKPNIPTGNILAPFSCCTDYETITVTDEYIGVYGNSIPADINADLISVGGLYNLSDKVEKDNLSDKEKCEVKDCSIAIMMNTVGNSFIGISMEGDIIIDLIKIYGDANAIQSFIRNNGRYNYYKEILNTIKKNMRPMPIIPAGILKLPENFICA